MGNPEDPQFEPHAGIKMAQVVGSPLYICGYKADLYKTIVEKILGTSVLMETKMDKS